MSAPSERWDRASALPVVADGTRRAELAALRPGRPDVATLFTFMRDAELRFGSLRLRLDEHRYVASGEHRVSHELLLVHPGRAKVTTIAEDGQVTRNHAIWISDGETIRTYQAAHNLATERPVRRRVVGLDDPDLPGTSRPYRPLTALPANSLVETFVHPAGYCQNVLATGACRVTGTDTVAGRETVVLTCHQPRTIELPADRPDHRLELAVDLETGLIARLIESFGDRLTRAVEATTLETDSAIPESAFTFAVPSDAATIF
jgi:outer membrane lipoprotein-sorting protein